MPFRRPQSATLFFQGNPNLKPQLTWHTELGYSWRNEFFITLAYDITRNYVRTFPYLDDNQTTITRRPTNVSVARSWNADFTYTKKLTSWWSTDNTLSFYQNSFNGQVGDFSLNNAGFASIYLTANNRFTISKTLSAEWDVEYDGRRQFVSSVYGAYTVVNVGLKKQVLADHGSLSLNANNILQTEDHNAIDRYSGLYQYANLHFYSRAIRVTFSYRFGQGKATKARTYSGSSDEQRRAGG